MNSLSHFPTQAARLSFRAYCLAINPKYQMAHHHRLLCDKLEAVERGDIKRLMVFMPPRHGKSETTSRLFPCWFLGRNPDKELIFSTYAQDLADDFGRTVRNRMNDPLHQLVFPHSQLAKDNASIRKFSTIKGGGFFGVGAGGPITGRGGDCVIIDDPLKNRAEAQSDTIRENLHAWFNSTLYTRLSPEGRLIIVQTRWHEDDLAGRILEETKGEGWDVINMPAINDAGEALWPERWGVEQLEEIKARIGSYEWSALYQQEPTPSGGGIIKRDWLRYYTALPEVNRYIWSWDTAIKTGQENDYSVGQLWAECDNGYYLVDMWRDRVEYPDLKRQVLSSYQARPSAAVLVEDKASGQQLVQDFKRMNIPVIAMMPGKSMPLSKQERVYLVSPLFESGRVFIPESVPWLADFINELVRFPSAPHDDTVDTCTQVLSYFVGQREPRIRIL